MRRAYLRFVRNYIQQIRKNILGGGTPYRKWFKYDALQTLNVNTSIISTSSLNQSQQHSMSDIVTALGPGRELDSLTSFAPDYVTVRQAFNNLLVFPHLEAIEIEDTSNSNLLSLVTDGNSRFSELSNIDIGLARKVISYDAAFSTLVGALNIQLLVMTLQPIAKEYADHARTHSEANQKFFADVSHALR